MLNVAEIIKEQTGVGKQSTGHVFNIRVCGMFSDCGLK